MINHAMRSNGVGASEVACLLGLSPYGDAFSVWARKLNLVDESEPNVRQRKGKFFEAGIAAWYSEETGNPTEWFDSTIQHPKRSWMVCTPDAWVLDKTSLARVGGMDSKMVSFQFRDDWGEPGTTNIPDHYAIQLQWSCATAEMPWWDCAACIGDELRVYRIHRDADIEAVLLETVERFWNENILGRTQPPIGATQAATDYIKKRFPNNVQPLRVATPEEVELMVALKEARERWDAMEAEYNPIENELKLAIGEAEGLIHGPWRITYRKDADSTGTDWRAMAHDLGQTLESIRAELRGSESEHGFARLTEIMSDLPANMAILERSHQIVTRKGSRKLLPKFGKVK